MKISILQHRHLLALPHEMLVRADRITCCELVVKDKHGLIDTTYLEHIRNPRAH